MSLPRVVLVTGASSGIGRATAHLLAGRGERLVLLARSAGPLADTAAECRARGAASVVVVTADVTDDGGVRDAVRGVVARHGRLDAVVHSAGVVAYGRVEDVPADVWDGVVRTNVGGTAVVARAVLPVMRAQGWGVLVILGSVLGQIAVPQMSAYTSSKWAIRSLARSLQLETRDAPGVDVCLVTPGGVDTPIYRLAATYTGRSGAPPPPVDSPEKVARAVVRALDRPRSRVGVGAANPVMTAGFVLLPRVYDALVGPLFRAVALGAAVRDGPGNVLGPVAGHGALRGGFGTGARALVQAVGRAVTRR